jgi:hypothetical protein
MPRLPPFCHRILPNGNMLSAKTAAGGWRTTAMVDDPAVDIENTTILD